MKNILLFSGTSEGNEIAQWLASRQTCQVTVCSATEYGSSLVAQSPRIRSLSKRMDALEMRALIEQEGFDCVIDATHPYAAIVSANINEAASKANASLIRVCRESEPEGDWIGATCAKNAAEIAAAMPGNILLATGAKELATYASIIPDYPNRVFARVLPIESSITTARETGLPISHIIAMQGPFSQIMNEAIIREFDIAAMVTKASGSTGGFWEKVDAARDCGIDLIVIHHPPNADDGMPVQEAKKVLEAEFGL